MTIVEALKKIVTALGGTPENENTVVQVLEDIAANVSGGGSGGIPAPADPSNGDVLTYNSTSEEWEAKAPSGGTGKFVVTFEYTADYESVTSDKTYAEILAAFNAGKEIMGVIDDTTSIIYLPLSSAVPDNANGNFYFAGAATATTDDPSTPQGITLKQEVVIVGVTDSVESIDYVYTDVTIPLT